MLNIFALTEAINSNASGRINVDSIEAYPFHGSVTEAAAEFNYQLLREAADIAHYSAGADEIMVEAAVSNPDTLSTITEGVFSTLKENVKAFFDKLIKMAKGLRDRVKAFFFKLTGKTNKWLSIMRPKIEAVQRNGGVSDIEAEMHEWNVEFVTKGFLAGYSDVINNYMNDQHIDVKQTWPAIEKDLTAMAAKIPGQNDADPDSKNTKERIRIEDDYTKNCEDILKKAKDGFPAYLAGKFGVSANSSMEAMWQAVVTKANGGEKKTVKFHSKVGEMLTALENNKQGLQDMEKAYNDHIKKLVETRKEIEDNFRKFEVAENKAPTEYVNAVKARMNAVVNQTTSMYSMVESAGSTACGMNTRFMKDMASEFMSVLTKFASHKSKKDT